MDITLSPQPRTRQEIADIVGHTPKTLYRRIQESGILIESRSLLTLDEQYRILLLFGRTVLWEHPTP